MQWMSGREPGGSNVNALQVFLEKCWRRGGQEVSGVGRRVHIGIFLYL